MARSLVSQNRPMPVVWCGWESNTYKLGQCGWEIAIEEVLYDCSMELFMYHPTFDIVARGRCRDVSALRGERIGHFGGSPPIFEIINVCAREHIVRMFEHTDLSTFHRIDTMPTMREWFGHPCELPLFAELFAPKAGAQELIIDPQDVQAMLDQIMKVQAPIRREIRERDRIRERRVHAEIVSLAA